MKRIKKQYGAGTNDIMSLSLGNMEKVPDFARRQFRTWRLDEGNGGALTKFLALESDGKSMEGKTLVELARDPNTSTADKALVEEYIKR